MGLNLIPAGYKQTEVGVIPEDWVIEKLGVIGKFKNGINKSADDFGYGYPFVNLMDVFGKPEIIGDEHFGLINSTELDKKEYSLVQGDVLFIRSSVKPSGVGLTTVVMSDLMDTVYSGFLIRFRTDNQLVIEFKKHCFYEESFRNRVICASTISANTNINQDSLKDIYLVYPSSKKEQTAIANALSDVDALISELEKLIAKKQAIKTATMQQLLTGRTRLPQFALREDGSKKGTKQSILGEIPEDWEVKTYGEVFTFLSTSTNSRADLSEDGDFGYVHYGDIHTEWNNKLDLNKERLPRISKNIVSSAFVMDGDLIMADASEDYEGIGKTVEVFNVGDKQLVAGLHTFLLRDKEKVLADGFRGYLHSIPAVKSSFDRLATGMKVYGISKNNLSSVCIPVPSLEEQATIATTLSDMDAEIQALEQRLGKIRQIKQGMMQELLTGKTRLVQPLNKESQHG
ncbi:restriction endonuclease subunit S [Providencia stuartii]|nr:restriction endonuclease subunit S [Providencia stuartii]